MGFGDPVGATQRHRKLVLGLVMFAVATASPWFCDATSAKAATPTDVMFLFDTSGSMGGVIEEAALEIQQVMAQVDTAVPEVDYGLAEVRDYGGSEYDSGFEEGEDEDLPWRLVTPITANHALVSGDIGALIASGGGDAPEAYGRALFETDTNPDVGWRPGARHAIVLIADEVPHSPNVDAGIPEPLWLEPAPWDTGEELPGTWGIPGTQLPVDQGVEFLQVLSRLAADGKPLETVDYHETGPNYIHYWEYWAGLAGGQALEAGVGTKELAGKLLGLIERAAPPCATAATATLPSPSSPDGPPTALTPRFGQPGTQVSIAPGAGTRFCPGERPALGGVGIASLEDSTPAQMIFRVPPNAAGGLTVTSAAGIAGAPSLYEVDNFRFPWGFNVINSPGTGGGHSYDVHAAVTEEDLRSVFSDLGPKTSIAYLVAAGEAEAILKNGLCYGFSTLSQALYGDSHGVKHPYPLGWANSEGFQLKPTTTPYSLHEAASGNHALTHALLRAAITQLSPQVQENAWKKVTSAKALQAALDASFGAGQPATLLIEDRDGGHAMLAFNYQVTSEGLAVDVVDPNVPWGPSRPPSDYEVLQVHVKSNGSWTFTGSFGHGTFGDPVGGGSGTLRVVGEPPMPGGLSYVPSSSSGSAVRIDPGAGETVSAINYSASPGHGIPGDAEPQGLFADTRPNGLTVPSDHHIVTATIESKSGRQTNTVLVGPGFIDLADVPKSEADVTVSPDDGTIGAPALPAGTTLSATTVTGEVQQTATVTFSGRVRKPRVTVGKSGGVTVTTAGGSGKATVKMAAFASGQKAHAPRITVRVHGRTRIQGHTPKVKHRKDPKACKKASVHKKGHC
jgi:type II secretory pathway pseudopilin PulG